MINLTKLLDGAGEATVREPVRWFAEQMEKKLKEKDHRDGWDCCSKEWLCKRIADERNELKRRIENDPKDYPEIIREAADVANFAMMIADKARRGLLDSPVASSPSSPTTRAIVEAVIAVIGLPTHMVGYDEVYLAGPIRALIAKHGLSLGGE